MSPSHPLDRVLVTFLPTGLLVGRSLWLGCGDGQIVVLDAGSGGLQHRWVAHLAPVRVLTLVAGLIYSLASDGAIRGWPAVQPPPPDFVNAWKVGEVTQQPGKGLGRIDGAGHSLVGGGDGGDGGGGGNGDGGDGGDGGGDGGDGGYGGGDHGGDGGGDSSGGDDIDDGVAEALRMTPLRVLAGTWNVNVTRPQPASIQLWLGPRAEDADIVCVGLQVGSSGAKGKGEGE
ncbi:Fe2OG dioxygenase domain-containing protein, partial [Haematococcus lacustris]